MDVVACRCHWKKTSPSIPGRHTSVTEGRGVFKAWVAIDINSLAEAVAGSVATDWNDKDTC